MKSHRISLADLVRAGLIRANEPILMRQRSGPPREATIRGDGTIVLANGQECLTPSEAAKEAANVGSADGWLKWRVPRLANCTLDHLREQLRSG
jgi:hypothetical protein